MTEKDMQRLEDKLDHAILLARQSTPESLSPILSEVKNSIKDLSKKLDEHIETHEEDTKDMKETLAPMKKDFDDSRGFWNRMFFIGKVAGVLTAIGFLVTGTVALIKKLQ